MCTFISDKIKELVSKQSYALPIVVESTPLSPSPITSVAEQISQINSRKTYKVYFDDEIGMSKLPEKEEMMRFKQVLTEKGVNFTATVAPYNKYLLSSECDYVVTEQSLKFFNEMLRGRLKSMGYVSLSTINDMEDIDDLIIKTCNFTESSVLLTKYERDVDITDEEFGLKIKESLDAFKKDISIDTIVDFIGKKIVMAQHKTGNSFNIEEYANFLFMTSILVESLMRNNSQNLEEDEE